MGSSSNHFPSPYGHFGGWISPGLAERPGPGQSGWRSRFRGSTAQRLLSLICQPFSAPPVADAEVAERDNVRFWPSGCLSVTVAGGGLNGASRLLGNDPRIVQQPIRRPWNCSLPHYRIRVCGIIVVLPFPNVKLPFGESSAGPIAVGRFRESIVQGILLSLR